MSAPQGPVEVWLRRPRELQVTCTVVYDDEHTDELDIDSLSIRGGQREITGWFISRGYKPADRWETTQRDEHGDPVEVLRRFVPARRGSVSAEGVRPAS